MPTNKSDPRAVDAYLAGLPEAERAALEALRELIKSTLRDVQERISYGTSVIFARERDLVGFVAQPKHLSFFTMSPELATALREQIKVTHKLSGATILSVPIIRCRNHSSRRSCGRARRRRLAEVSCPLPVESLTRRRKWRRSFLSTAPAIVRGIGISWSLSFAREVTRS